MERVKKYADTRKKDMEDSYKTLENHFNMLVAEFDSRQNQANAAVKLLTQQNKDIEQKILNDGYTPKTSMENLITMIVLSFDCDDNYGEYDEETGCGGYGEEFTLEECFRYIEESGGYAEFDYYC